MGALTSMWAVPLVIYLLSKNLTPRAFVEAAGFLLLVGCLPLSVGYLVTGLVTIDILYPALASIIAALLGFQIGEHLRQKIDGALFRRILLWFFFVMGCACCLWHSLSSEKGIIWQTQCQNRHGAFYYCCLQFGAHPFYSLKWHLLRYRQHRWSFFASHWRYDIGICDNGNKVRFTGNKPRFGFRPSLWAQSITSYHLPLSLMAK